MELLARSRRSGEQLGAGRRELHISAALVHPKPAALDRELEAGAVFGRSALELGEERPVDLLDVDAFVLHRLDRVGDLQELARGSLGIGEGTVVDELPAAILTSLSAPRITIRSASSGSGRCNAFASSHDARIQTSLVISARDVSKIDNRPFSGPHSFKKLVHRQV